jgi:hypothetical protein
LPSVSATALGKEDLPVSRCAFFAEYSCHDTRQSTSLPSVALDQQSDQNTPTLFVFAIPSKQTKDVSHNHHIYHKIITYIKHTT